MEVGRNEELYEEVIFRFSPANDRLAIASTYCWVTDSGESPDLSWKVLITKIHQSGDGFTANRMLVGLRPRAALGLTVDTFSMKDTVVLQMK